MIFARAMGNALRHALTTDPRVVVLGEDIADPYGGAFKVTRGLSTEFPGRVRTTPISEQALAGVSAGLALAGFRPITEFMFGDFIALAFDQVLNHIAKYQTMYHGAATCPVIFRIPSGGGRGYGPTHSQSLEKYFIGIPNLRVVAGSLYIDPSTMLSEMLSWDTPSLFIEHKLLYPQHLTPVENGRVGELLVSIHEQSDMIPTISMSMVPPESCTITLVAYGYQATAAQRVVKELAVSEEIFVELIVAGQISPMMWGPVLASANRTGAVITVEEGTAGNSWGTEIAATLQRTLFGKLRCPVMVCTSDATVVPSAKRMESDMLAGPEKIRAAILEVAT